MNIGANPNVCSLCNAKFAVKAPSTFGPLIFIITFLGIVESANIGVCTDVHYI
jgi:hypothetical protein